MSLVKVMNWVLSGVLQLTVAAARLASTLSVPVAVPIAVLLLANSMAAAVGLKVKVPVKSLTFTGDQLPPSVRFRLPVMRVAWLPVGKLPAENVAVVPLLFWIVKFAALVPPVRPLTVRLFPL